MIGQEPLVTVYMPTHNRRTLLERALKSVINQTYKNLEIIVVDDGSTDDTEKFMKEYIIKYPTVKYLKHNTPKGANVARNYALRESTGYFVTGFDDDDEMYPERIEKMVDGYDEQFAYIFTGYTLLQTNRRIEYNIKDKYISLSDMLMKNVTGNQVLTTRQMFFEAGLFDENLVAAQDYDMWIRMLKIKPLAKAIQTPLMYFYDCDHERITNSIHKRRGYIQCFFKHKALMTKDVRKSKIIVFRDMQKKQIKAVKMIALYPLKKRFIIYLGYNKRILSQFFRQ